MRRILVITAVSVVLFSLAPDAVDEPLGGLGVPGGAIAVRNETGGDALGFRVRFDQRVRIADYDKGIFPSVSPGVTSWYYVFSGGRLRPDEAFELSWRPSTATIRTCEWITEDGISTVGGFACTYTMHPSLSRLDTLLRQAYDGLVLCLVPGVYELPSAITLGRHVTLRGTGSSITDVVIATPTGAVLRVDGGGRLSFENLSIDGAVFEAADGAHLTLRRASLAGSVCLEGNAGATIDDSSLLGSVTAAGDGSLAIRRSTIEGDATDAALTVEGAARVTVADSRIRGAASGIRASGTGSIHIETSDFAKNMPVAVDLAGFTGALTGEGNVVSRDALVPHDFDWPDGFVANSEP